MAYTLFRAWAKEQRGIGILYVCTLERERGRDWFGGGCFILFSVWLEFRMKSCGWRENKSGNR